MTSKSKTLKTRPSEEQMQALRAFASKYGRSWKQELSDQWLNGSDANEPDGHLLRQVRNTYGPSWLVKFKL